jgi:high affinity sulfate transporter 1
MPVRLPPESRSVWARRLPVTVWVRDYKWTQIGGDLFAALTVWALLVPEALAYAGIAGVPPQYGLYCAPAALLAYAVFGGSRHLIVGPTSTVAIVSASVVAPLAAGGDERYLALTIALALLTGAILVAAGLARFGFVARLLAKPVLDGFILGLAITIAAGQVAKLLGVHADGETALEKTVSMVSQVSGWAWLPLLVGGLALVILLLLERFVPRLPAAIVIAGAGILATYLLGLSDKGLAIVGAVPGGLPGWQLTGLSLDDVYHLLPGACAVALVAFTESIAVAKDDASRHGGEVDADQEMIANGFANIGAGLLQGFAVNGSLSKTAAGEAAGGRTQIVSLVCAVLTVATILFLTGLFTYLPEAVLGAIVIVALRSYFSVTFLTRLYRVRKADFALSAAALAGVLVAGVVPGIVIGVVLSLGLLLLRTSSPNSAVLGRSAASDEFADVSTHPECAAIDGILIYRFDGPLVFPTADRFAHEVRSLARLAGADQDAAPLRAVIVDFEAVADMDTTAADQLAHLADTLAATGVRLLVARVHAHVLGFMRTDGLLEKLGDRAVFPRIQDAVASLAERGEVTARSPVHV